MRHGAQHWVETAATASDGQQHETVPTSGPGPDSSQSATETGTAGLGPALALGGQRSCEGSRPGAA